MLREDFMLRKSIVMMALAAAFTMNVSAVQIEVSTSPFLRWEKLRCTQQAKAHK